MPILSDYDEFEGRHWETGAVRNFLAYRRVTAPHSGAPYSEALLMGVSGGAVMGYFTFAYEGYDPQLRLLTRNTFDPLDTMLARLGIVQHRQQTASGDKGRANLLETLAEGVPAIVWADHYSLPYNALRPDAGMWAMFPILVYGQVDGAVWIADRAAVPLTAPADELHAARARVKKDKFRLLTLDPPLPQKLVSAVQAGIWDCIKLYTENPPKGAAHNFGLAAYRHWIKLLTKPKTRNSWEKEFPAGRKLLAGLMGVVESVHIFGEPHAERKLYADFLDEAAVILERPSFHNVAAQFRESAQAWDGLAAAVLPDDVPVLRETRELMLARKRIFIQAGNAAVPRMKEIDARLAEIKTAMETEFPLDAAGVTALRESIAAHVARIHDVEETAVAQLKTAMA